MSVNVSQMSDYSDFDIDLIQCANASGEQPLHIVPIQIMYLLFFISNGGFSFVFTRPPTEDGYEVDTLCLFVCM